MLPKKGLFEPRQFLALRKPSFEIRSGLNQPYLEPMRLPDFIIIGAMKCGTSTLHTQLSERSGIYMSTPKEPNFFGDDLYYQEGIGAYSTLFEGAKEDQICGESSTHYTKIPTFNNVAERIHLALPQAKFIYIMRNPIDRLISQYIHEWSQGEVDVPIDQAVTKYERFVSYSSYGKQLKPYHDIFGVNSVLPVFFESMIGQPDQEFERILRFLNDPSPEEKKWKHDLSKENVSSKRFKKGSLYQTLREVSALKSVFQLLPERVRESIKDLWRMSKRPELSDYNLQRIQKEVDVDLEYINDWLGLNLSCKNWQAELTIPK